MAQNPAFFATLVVSCPDRRGLVAGLAQFLTGLGANIFDAEQHRDAETNIFFQRIRFDMSEMYTDRVGLENGVRELATRFQMTVQLTYGDHVPRMAILVSKFDHCLYDLILRQRAKELPCEIPLIISNHEDLRCVEKQFNIPYHCISVTEKTKADAEERQIRLLRDHRIDVVILARYMQVLSQKFIEAFPSRIINIHHSFLPAFAGGKPYHQAMEHGVKLIGATSHYVTPQLDEGPIIEQDVVRVSHRESIEDLVQKGRDVEKVVLARAVRAHLEQRVVVCGKKTIVFG
jgi:formyltetrahydrofolate deformylase